MKKIVLKFGLYSAITILALFNIAYFLLNNLSYSAQEIVGYLSMFIALSFTFFGIKAYRDEYLGGKISFGRALGTGMLIALFPALIFGIFDVIYVNYINPDYMTQLYAQAVMDLKTHYTGNELAAKLAEMEQMKTMSNSGFFMFILMFLTVLVMGFIVSLISAITLRRR